MKLTQALRNFLPATPDGRYNAEMKTWIILLSMLAIAASWWWGKRRLASSQKNSGGLLRLIGRSLMAGAVTYFFLISMALIYLTFTSK
ncbi:hypothetical protein H0A70_08890 [Alcaligenaceae bacterium]|nr:hypothetical protein [Alcaligenaceae bacterium]